jgi:hypothetical protein
MGASAWLPYPNRLVERSVPRQAVPSNQQLRVFTRERLSSFGLFLGTATPLLRYVIGLIEDERNRGKRRQFIRKAIRPSSRMAFSLLEPAPIKILYPRLARFPGRAPQTPRFLGGPSP